MPSDKEYTHDVTCEYFSVQGANKLDASASITGGIGTSNIVVKGKVSLKDAGALSKSIYGTASLSTETLTVKNNTTVSFISFLQQMNDIDGSGMWYDHELQKFRYRNDTRDTLLPVYDSKLTDVELLTQNTTGRITKDVCILNSISNTSYELSIISPYVTKYIICNTQGMDATKRISFSRGSIDINEDDGIVSLIKTLDNEVHNKKKYIPMVTTACIGTQLVGNKKLSTGCVSIHDSEKVVTLSTDVQYTSKFIGITFNSSPEVTSYSVTNDKPIMTSTTTINNINTFDATMKATKDHTVIVCPNMGINGNIISLNLSGNVSYHDTPKHENVSKLLHINKDNEYMISTDTGNIYKYNMNDSNIEQIVSSENIKEDIYDIKVHNNSAVYLTESNIHTYQLQNIGAYTTTTFSNKWSSETSLYLTEDYSTLFVYDKSDIFVLRKEFITECNISSPNVISTPEYFDAMSDVHTITILNNFNDKPNIQTNHSVIGTPPYTIDDMTQGGEENRNAYVKWNSNKWLVTEKIKANDIEYIQADYKGNSFSVMNSKNTVNNYMKRDNFSPYTFINEITPTLLNVRIPSDMIYLPDHGFISGDRVIFHYMNTDAFISVPKINTKQLYTVIIIDHNNFMLSGVSIKFSIKPDEVHTLYKYYDIKNFTSNRYNSRHNIFTSNELNFNV